MRARAVFGSGQPDVVVIGAGVMGLATARALAQAGRDVLVLEQDVVGTRRGSSHGSSRIFRLAYKEEQRVRLAQEALPLWRELERETGTDLVAARGALDVGGDFDGLGTVLSTCGFRFEVLGAEEALERFGVEIGARRALHQPDGGVVWADAALAALSSSARSQGARLAEGRRVLSLGVGGDGVRIEASDGALEARVAVVTAGSWAPPLLATAGFHLPVTVTRETAVYFGHPAPAPPPAVVDWRPPDATAWGLRREGLAAYALDAGGGSLKAGLHQAGPVVDPDKPGDPDTAVVDCVADWVSRTFPSAEKTPLRAETCLYTSTADDRFVLERHWRIVVGSPCSGQGFKFAPAIGARLAALAAEALE
jgi:sarcosine oxidase